MGIDDIFSVFSDLFGDAFGGRGCGGRGVGRGVDIQAVVEVELRDVATGVEKSLRFERADFCDRCGGNGRAGLKTSHVPHLRRLRAG